MVSADFSSACAGEISPGNGTLLLRTAAGFASTGIPAAFGCVVPPRRSVSAFYPVLVHQLARGSGTMLAPDLETDIPITGQVHVGDDIQVPSYDQKVFTAPSPLSYDGKPNVSVGDPVYLLIENQSVKAHVTRYSLLEGHRFKSETSFVGQGGSGSPVISGLTGKVVGVFLGGENGDTMTEGYFEELEMP